MNPLFNEKGWIVYGTEASSISNIAAKKVGEKEILIDKDFEKLKNIDISFDIITFWHVLEHLNKPKEVLD